MPTDEQIEAEKKMEEANRIRAIELGCAAKFDIRYAARMTEKGKLAIAEWLRLQAENLLVNGHDYAEIFTARYNPEEDSEL